MPDLYTIYSDKAVVVGADATNQKKLTNRGGGTFYYKATSDVGSGDTAVTSGSSVTFDATQWIISASTTNIVAENLNVTTAQDSSITDDLTVGDDATITDDLTVSGDAAVTGTLAVTSTTTLTGAASTVGGIVTGGATPTTAAKGITFGTGADPVTLYRSAANVLTTDDAFVATGGVTSTGTLVASNAATVGTTLGVTGVLTATGGVTTPAAITLTSTGAGTGYIELFEQSGAPSAPAAGGCRIFCIDDTDKTELAALFASGTRQEICQEP